MKIRNIVCSALLMIASLPTFADEGRITRDILFTVENNRQEENKFLTETILLPKSYPGAPYKLEKVEIVEERRNPIGFNNYYGGHKVTYYPSKDDVKTVTIEAFSKRRKEKCAWWDYDVPTLYGATLRFTFYSDVVAKRAKDKAVALDADEKRICEDVEKRDREAQEALKRVRLEGLRTADKNQAAANKDHKEKLVFVQETLEGVIVGRDAKIRSLCRAFGLALPSNYGYCPVGEDPSRAIEIASGPSDGAVALIGSGGKYLTFNSDTQIFDTSDRWEGAWQSFFLETLEEDSEKRTVAFKSALGPYLSASPEGQLFPASDRNSWEQFVLRKIGGGNKFTIESIHGQYVSFTDKSQVFTYSNPVPKKDIQIVMESDHSAFIENHYGRYLTANPENGELGSRDDRRCWQSFDIEFLDENKKTVRLRSNSGKYLGARPDGTFYQTDNRGHWEQFISEKKNSENSFNIKTRHGKYVAFLPNGVVFTQGYRSAKTNITVLNGPGSIGVKARIGRYLTGNPESNQIYSRGFWAGEWESFNLETLREDGESRTVRIRSATGNYLGAHRDGTLYLTTNQGSWEEFVLEKVEIFNIKTVHNQYIGFLENGQIVVTE